MEGVGKFGVAVSVPPVKKNVKLDYFPLRCI